MRPWIKYSLIRFVLFAGSLTVLLLWTPAPLWLAPIMAAAIGLCVSYIFFRPQRDEVAATIVARRAKGAVNADEDEDDAIDHQQK